MSPFELKCTYCNKTEKEKNNNACVSCFAIHIIKEELKYQRKDEEIV